MKTKYRIKKVYSVDAHTGHPETNYMVEAKKGLFGQWLGVRMFVTEIRALKHIEELKSGS